LISTFNDDVGGVTGPVSARKPERGNALISTGNITDRKPALWVPLRRGELRRAFDAFKDGMPEIYFGTNAQIGKARDLQISNVYFKETGQPEVVAKARLIEITVTNLLSKRIGKDEFKFYYGFRDLIMLQSPIPLSSLVRFNNEKAPVLYTAQSPCIIEEISI
jgi:hypothetical protein